MSCSFNVLSRYFVVSSQARISVHEANIVSKDSSMFYSRSIFIFLPR